MEVSETKQVFIATDTEFENKDIKLLESKIENAFLKLENKLLTKDDIKEIVKTSIDTHKTDCDLCKGNYLTVENCYSEWIKCYEKHSSKQIQNLNKYLEVGKKALWIILPIAAYMTGNNIDKLLEVLK